MGQQPEGERIPIDPIQSKVSVLLRAIYQGNTAEKVVLRTQNHHHSFPIHTKEAPQRPGKD